MKNNILKIVSILYRKKQMNLVKRLQKYNLGAFEITILMILFKSDGVSQETLAVELSIDKAAMTRALATLEEKGYLTRNKDPYDKRKNQVFLTSYAKENQTSIKKIMHDSNDELLKDIDKKDIDIAYQVLAKMIDNIGV